MLYDHWCRTLDEQCPPRIDAVFLDFSRAFDTVSHARLLDVLRSVGICGQIHAWIASFLSRRLQRVVYQGHYSDWVPVTSGVPQGSILGPVLFLLYSNFLKDVVSPDTYIYQYADDTVVYRIIRNPKDTICLQSDLNRVHNVCQNKKLFLNSDKTELLVITRSLRPDNIEYTINRNMIKEVSNHKHLGVHLSSDLTWNYHVAKICSQCRRLLGFIFRTCRSANVRTFKLLYVAIVRPILEYCSAVWSPFGVGNTQKIESIQRKATRYMCILDRRPITDYNTRLNTFRLMSLKRRRDLSSVVLGFKALNGLLVHRLDQYWSRSRSARMQGRLLLNRNRTTCLLASFCNRFPRLWNKLPQNVIQSESLELFRAKASIFYLENEYIP